MNLADDPELCELMVRAGFKKVFVGIETPSTASPAGMRQTPELPQGPGRIGHRFCNRRASM